MRARLLWASSWRPEEKAGLRALLAAHMWNGENDGGEKRDNHINYCSYVRAVLAVRCVCVFGIATTRVVSVSRYAVLGMNCAFTLSKLGCSQSSVNCVLT